MILSEKATFNQAQSVYEGQEDYMKRAFMSKNLDMEHMPSIANESMVSDVSDLARPVTDQL